MYRQLTVIQRITFKGWLKHPETRPKSKHFDESVHQYMNGLYAIWLLNGFECAVNQFFINTP